MEADIRRVCGNCPASVDASVQAETSKPITPRLKEALLKVSVPMAASQSSITLDLKNG
ncbi:hypothetical protein ACFYPZ_40795 [Streptomyces sp. NPDC005506]|uniref:hypothetical protein n=1 Tax=unclassified Streptomyces TaxID=2593676 RepID=UPI0036C07F14